ncbi:DUF4419 domain-containing protein [Kordia sp.]|uniref:DUF4419 domain-containing protein n=1 Tax=Kordia sp. TaxID=1965332 RepID=UPI003B58DB80
MMTTKTENSIIFDIETLERPTKLVDEKVFSEIVQTFSSKIEYLPNADEKLISGGYHSFLYGLYLAYSEHRPFTLSPDMIWLLVLQGISNHVNFSHKTKEDLFPQLTEKKTLSIRNDKIILGNPDSPWHETTSTFSDEIENIVGSEMISELRADFSTTNLASKVVSEITIMDAFKAYFEYEIAVCICGIPEMKLEGSAADWNKMLDKLNVLNKYNMTWWYDDLQPIITNIKQTAEGTIDNDFWMQIFKVHTIDDYGEPKCIDGWITKFFPYNRQGERIDLRTVHGLNVESIFEELPKQIATVNFKHLLCGVDGTILEETPMEYWGGFTGIMQEHDTQFLKPQINWFISHQTKEFEKEIDPEIENHEFYTPSRKYYNLVEIPEEVFDEPKWMSLRLSFRGNVIIPEKFKELKISLLIINGTIDEDTIERLKSYFDSEQTSIYINDKTLYKKDEIPVDYETQLINIKKNYTTAIESLQPKEGIMLMIVENLQKEAIEHQNQNFSEVHHKALIDYLKENLINGTLFDDDEIKKINLTLKRLAIRKTPCIQEEKYNYLRNRIVDFYVLYGSVVETEKLDFIL